VSAQGRERRCDKSDLPVSMCAHCLGHRGVDEVELLVAAGPAFRARFGGRCVAVCGTAIRVGDLIVPVEDSTGHAHLGCVRA
jgi:hypothetical protein